MLKQLRRLFDHMYWADERSVTLIADLDPDSTARSEALRLLAHIVAAEEIWLARANARESPTVALPIWPEWSLEEVKAASARVRAGFDGFLDALTRSDLDRAVEYRNSKGVSFRTRLADILLHVAMHGGYHRGQMARTVRSAGAEPVNTDFITYVRELGRDA